MENPYEIDLMELKEGKIKEYDWHIGKAFFESLGNTDIPGCDIEVHLQAEKRHGSYMLEFDFIGSIESPCDRCLEPVKIPVETVYDVLVKHGDEYDDSADDMLIIPESRTRLDVSPLIYDTLLLEIPLRCVHEEGECDSDMIDRINDQ